MELNKRKTSLIWYRNNICLSQNNQFEISDENYSYYLQITPSIMEDGGMGDYKATTNDSGTIISSATISYTGKVQLYQNYNYN